MKFSIVTISYNQSKYLEKTINSILTQKDVDLEYIIVDPGSTDGSKDIINKYKDRITKNIFETDLGPADGLNKGFSNAKGDIYGFINSDDMLVENSLKMVQDFFLLNPQVDIVLGNGYVIDENDQILRKVYPDRFSLKKYAYSAFNFIQPSMFIRSSCFLDVGGFNINNKTCWDGEFLVASAFKNKKITVLREFLSMFRFHNASISGLNKNYNTYINDRNRIMNDILNENKHYNILSQIYRLKSIIETPQKLFSKYFL
jgi:glycosyltransferase involved in cell wall biosynthesis